MFQALFNNNANCWVLYSAGDRQLNVSVKKWWDNNEIKLRGTNLRTGEKNCPSTNLPTRHSTLTGLELTQDFSDEKGDEPSGTQHGPIDDDIHLYIIRVTKIPVSFGSQYSDIRIFKNYKIISNIYEVCPVSIQPREPIAWTWCNLAASQKRPYSSSVNRNAPVGLVSRQWVAADSACVLCDSRFHKSHFQRRF